MAYFEFYKVSKRPTPVRSVALGNAQRERQAQDAPHDEVKPTPARAATSPGLLSD